MHPCERGLAMRRVVCTTISLPLLTLGFASGTLAAQVAVDSASRAAWTQFLNVTVLPRDVQVHWIDTSAARQTKKVSLRFSMYASRAPEYDDMQRLPMALKPHNPNCDEACKPKDYGALAVVFASDYLDRWEDVDFVNAGARGIPVAEICAEDAFDTLQLVKTPPNADYHCQDPNTLFIRRPNGTDWEAWMLRKIGGTWDPKQLDIRRIDYRDDKFCEKHDDAKCGDDLPPVARFDWIGDSPVISVRCGLGWCDVFPKNYAKSEAKPGNSGSRRELRVKGWHDRQHLMLVDTPTKPSDRLMTVIPAQGLGDMTKNKFSTFQPVAYIDNPVGYKTYTTTTGTDSLFRSNHKGKKVTRQIVQIEATTDDKKWKWQMLYLDKDGTVVDTSPEFIAIRTEHEDFPIVSAARWRWHPTDEMIWVRCANGCCELTDTPFSR